ncbi:hypothetical protein [Mycobacteroides abscessus]|uniref:hypothetical protein n=1 Tax=Mycobacteroides abscessus TaxID=36809 RepID=UPI001055E83D|nr:hypothetical protein [Mycobacteroides abscessus]
MAGQARAALAGADNLVPSAAPADMAAPIELSGRDATVPITLTTPILGPSTSSNGTATAGVNDAGVVPSQPMTWPSLKTLLHSRILLSPGHLPVLPPLPRLETKVDFKLLPTPAEWSIKPMVDLSLPTVGAGLSAQTPLLSVAVAASLTFPTTPAHTGTSAPSTVSPPSANDTVDTPYGQIGKWMLNSHGKVSDWIGRALDGRTLYEPINLVLIDRSSKAPEQARENLIVTLERAGFPNYLLHSSGGYSALFGDNTYGQYPDGLMQVFSNGPIYATNDHGRLFGPAPIKLPDGSGYVWSSSFSRETGALDGRPNHQYSTFEGAESDVVQGLLAAGAQQLPSLNLDNVYNTPTATTGDNDGQASVFDISSPLLAATALGTRTRRRQTTSHKT